MVAHSGQAGRPQSSHSQKVRRPQRLQGSEEATLMKVPVRHTPTMRPDPSGSQSARRTERGSPGLVPPPVWHHHWHRARA